MTTVRRQPRRLLALIATGLLALGSISANPVDPAGAADPPTASLLVRFDPAASADARRVARANAHATLDVRSRAVAGLEVWDLPSGDVERAIRALRQRPDVRYAEPDRPVSVAATPDDPLLGNQWAMSAIDAPTAWDVTTGSPDVAVAVLDTGADLDHPDLAGNLWTNPDELAGNGVDDDANGYIDDVNGWDFCNVDAVPQDDNGHGSHVAGTIAAVGANATGVAGVAWDAAIVPLKILCADGRGNVSSAVAALDYALAEGIPISNSSWAWSGTPSQALSDAITAAEQAGHLFVAAAGNFADDADVLPAYPAAYPQGNVISVAATDSADGLWSSSNWGARSVDLGAPGVSITSTGDGGGYASRTGTSHAAPHVAGVAVLLRAAEPSWQAPELRAALLGTTRPAVALSTKTATGGVLDAGAAVSTTTVTEITPASEKTATGTVAGSLSALAAVDGSVERLSEVTTGKAAKQTSALDHTWRFELPARSDATLHVQASASSSADADEFVVSWSTDATTFTHVVTIPPGAAGAFQAPLPPGTATTLWLRVVDSDRARGAVTLDALVVDRLVVAVTAGDGPPPPPPIELTASTSKVKGQPAVRLDWVGTTSAHVLRDGALLVTTDALTYVDSPGKETAVTYQVCDGDTGQCSNTVTVVIS